MVKMIVSNSEEADVCEILNKVNACLGNDSGAGRETVVTDAEFASEVRTLEECRKYTEQNYKIPDAYPIVSMRRFGRVITSVKKVIRKAVRWYVSEINARQVLFNKRVTISENQNVQLWQLQMQRNEELKAELAEMTKRLEQLEAKYTEPEETK